MGTGCLWYKYMHTFTFYRWVFIVSDSVRNMRICEFISGAQLLKSARPCHCRHAFLPALSSWAAPVFLWTVVCSSTQQLASALK